MTDDCTQTTRRELRRLFSGLVRAGDVLEGTLNEVLESGLGISLSHCDVLTALAAAPEGRLRMKDISRRLVVTKTTVTRLVDQLQARGLVERAACAEDRRVVWAGITAEGRRLLRKATPLIDDGLDRFLGPHLEADDGHVLSRLLQGIVDGREPAGSEKSGGGAKRPRR